MAIFTKQPPTARAPRPSTGESTLTIISAGTAIHGDISCPGVLKVDGNINGSVREARQVMLAKDSSIHGDVTAHEAVLGGVVDGNVTATDRLELQPTSVVNGNITTKSIVVMEGARINGSVRMTELALVGRVSDGREARIAR